LALPLNVDFLVAILALPRHLRDGAYAILFPLDVEIDLSAFDIATRLICAVLAGVSMIQVNLPPLAGKAPDSFIVMDLPRFPPGILSGMDFMGNHAASPLQRLCGSLR
jgi:hypothetical protein